MAFCVWLTLLSIVFSRFNCTAACISTSFHFMTVYSIVQISHIQQLLDIWVFFFFYSLTVINNADMNICKQTCWWVFNFLRYMPRNEISGSYGNSVLNFLKKFWNVPFYIPTSEEERFQFFHILVNTYHCPSFSLYPKWVWSGIFMVLFCISLVTDDAEYLSVCLYNIGYLLWRTAYSNPLPVF